MKYFTKYLPVEGEIKEGNWYIWKNNKALCRATGDLDILNNHLKHKDIEKVKLFLCSRNIQVGDKFNSANGINFVCTRTDDTKIYCIGGLNSDIEEVPHSICYAYKVIGEVSLAATFVKEGDEFEEDQVLIHYPPTLFSATNPVIQIKGVCGHFH